MAKAQRRTNEAGITGEKYPCICMGVGPELTALLRKLGVSDEVHEHFRNARLEVLKGIRTMIDERIEHLSRRPAKGTAIPVD